MAEKTAVVPEPVKLGAVSGSAAAPKGKLVDNKTISAVVSSTLERAALVVEDLSEPVYRRYFAADPDAAALMAHMDDLTRGRMLNEVLRLLMEWDPVSDSAYLNFEVRNHQYAYRVESRMYRELLVALRDVVAQLLGDSFEPDRVAWESRIAGLLAEIEARAG